MSQALILSGALNIGLVGTFLYSLLKEVEIAPHSQISAFGEVVTLPSVWKGYTQLPFEELVDRLEQQDHIERGISRRDLALAVLVSAHHFDLSRALGSEGGRQVVTFSFLLDGQKVTASLYPGLSNEEFAAISRFARTEKWPYDAEGLFLKLQHSLSSKDSSLVDAFALTDIYTSLARLAEVPHARRAAFVELLCEGNWAKLCEMAKFDPSEEHRRQFFVSWMSLGSKSAARWFLAKEGEAVLRRLDDATLALMLDLIPDRIAAEKAAKETLASFRSESLRKKAAIMLYGLAREPLPEPIDLTAATQRFCPQWSVVQPAAAPLVPQEVLQPVRRVEPAAQKIYIIQDGDSLWKIARRHKVSVEALKKANELDTDRLRTGRQLIIPERDAP